MTPKRKAKAKRPPVESTADFKERLAAMFPKPRQTPEEKQRDNPCIRTPADRGYYPPASTKRATEAAGAQRNASLQRPKIGQPYSEYTLEFTRQGIQQRETRYSAEALLRLAMDAFPHARVETYDQQITFSDATGSVVASIHRRDYA